MDDSQENFNQSHDSSDLKSSKFSPREESLEEVQIEYLEQIENHIVQIHNPKWLGQWVTSVLPFLKPAGKHGALILLLGIVSLPLSASSNALVALILALGASMVAILSCIQGQ